ncbi:hypothetical protein TELCIR_21951, partial [Teladorsagia circumcincta]
MDPSTGELRKISILFDTGAELSFIEQALANELGLQEKGKAALRLRTFGSNQVQQKDSHRVTLNIWDRDGLPLTLDLFTSDILTKPLSSPRVSQGDVDFIRTLDFPVSINGQTIVTKPQVLLGCDQLWTLIRDDQPQIRLPSGLTLLPTRLGHLLTGRCDPTRKAEQVTNVGNEDRWFQFWTLDTQVHTLSTEPFETPPKEEELWERFWALETAGTEEFGVSEKNVRSMVDQQVWDNFRNTVEKRDDGYYVRLPWKDIGVELPDNRAIAFKRLQSTWNSLHKDNTLLDRYNDIFEEQLQANIIEKVEDESQ